MVIALLSVLDIRRRLEYCASYSPVASLGKGQQLAKRTMPVF